MIAFVVVAAVGAGSYLFRVSMLVLAARGGLPPVLERAARVAVPVSFAALAAAALGEHVTAPASGAAPLVAVAVAVAAVRRTGSPHAALVAGMPTLWLISALGPG
ncbi:MAG TPA: AzlD domain-containing protein [Acidimicrobiales bacterium]